MRSQLKLRKMVGLSSARTTPAAINRLCHSQVALISAGGPHNKPKWF